MDQGTPYGFDAPGAGPDRILGTADDVDRDFEVDTYASRNYVLGGAEPFRGPLDTLNTIAFGLATGRR
jgi:hypothetical protein